MRRIDIEAADRRVRDDLLPYVRLLVGGERIGAALATGSRDVVVVTKADGNVGYLDALGRALDRAPDVDLPSVLSLAELPDDLEGLHRHFLRRIRAGAVRARRSSRTPRPALPWWSRPGRRSTARCSDAVRRLRTP